MKTNAWDHPDILTYDVVWYDMYRHVLRRSLVFPASFVPNGVSHLVVISLV